MPDADMLRWRTHIAVRSLNQVRSWHGRHQDRARWAKALLPLKTQWRPRGVRVRVTVWSYRARLLDQDNFIGGCKGLFDAMIALGLLVNDNARWLEHGPHRQVSVQRHNAGTVIWLEVVRPEPILPAGQIEAVSDAGH